MEEFLQVGAIANTHGIAGEVKVFPMTDDIKRFKKLKEVYLDTGKERKLLHVVSCKFVKNQPVLRFKEFSNINEVEMYKRKGLFVTRDQAVPLEKDEYFIADLIGLSVIREDNGEVLGELTDVLQTGANDVYEVKMEDGKEVLLPAIRECIKNVDLQKGEITVHVMKGLLDEFHILTLFPEMVMDGLNTSIIGRAIEAGLLEINAVNIRDYSTNKHMKVDDYPYGGGAGLVMQPEPVYRAYKDLEKDMKKKPRVVYLTPQGTTFHQEMAKELAKEEELVFLCGHYEGIDERVLEEIVTDYVSIGDYVLTGGELPAMVMIDSISRLVPGVLHNDDSAGDESFENGLLEYPQYTRPPVFLDKEVPEVLLSGHHENIRKWRHEQSVKRTKERRPDLWEAYEKEMKEKDGGK